MAYVPCHACGAHHKNIPQAQLVKALDELQAGNGHLVTKDGIEPRCILDVLEIPAQYRDQHEMINSRGRSRNTGYGGIISPYLKEHAA